MTYCPVLLTFLIPRSCCCFLTSPIPFTRWAELYRIPYECQELDEDFRSERGLLQGERWSHLPNQCPTAIYEELDVVEDIIAHNQDVIVIVDEAYIDFADGPHWN